MARASRRAASASGPTSPRHSALSIARNAAIFTQGLTTGKGSPSRLRAPVAARVSDGRLRRESERAGACNKEKKKPPIIVTTSYLPVLACWGTARRSRTLPRCPISLFRGRRVRTQSESSAKAAGPSSGPRRHMDVWSSGPHDRFASARRRIFLASPTALATTRERGYCVNPLRALDRYLSWMSPTFPRLSQLSCFCWFPGFLPFSQEGVIQLSEPSAKVATARFGFRSLRIERPGAA